MATLTIDDRQALVSLRLGAWPGIGERALARLVDRAGSPERALRLLGGARDTTTGLAAAERALEAARAAGARVVGLGRRDYPARLTALADPPPVLFAKGDRTLLARPAVTIVGSRRASEYGRRVASGLAAALAEQGLVIVSGLAMGIDSEAHGGALGVAGATAAVLGAGVAVPPSGRRGALFRRVAEDGLLLSEFGPQEPARPHHFPRRNRILAALATSIVVVEAAERSGALITVRHGLDVGATIWAVPGSIWSSTSRGCLRLLEEGAKVVVSIEEAAEAIVTEAAVEWPDNHPRMPMDAPSRRTQEPELPADADGPLARVLQALGSQPMLLDAIIERAGLPAGRTSKLLARLEIQGSVVQLPGLRFARRSTAGK